MGAKMTNKCPNCGFEYGEEDIFCSRCGFKISFINSTTVREINKFTRENYNNKEIKSSFSGKNVLKFFDNMALNAVIFMIVVLGVLCISLMVILSRHDNQRITLQYKNLIQNPAQIPMLKEPKTYIELSHNLKDVEDFLTLYLENSTDSQDRKNQIFASYLTQIQKMPNVLNQKFNPDTITECKSSKNAANCAKILNEKYNNRTVSVYLAGDIIYLYPNYKKIDDKYKKYLSNDFKGYLSLLAKYDIPVQFGLGATIEPKKLVNKIYDFEQFSKKNENQFIDEELKKTLYFDIRKLLFTPANYATLTHELDKKYKNAYLYFINSKKDSIFKPIIMSYMEKGKNYTPDNFKNDYPLKQYNPEDFNKNIEQSSFDDVFMQLRKKFFDDKSAILPLTFVYNVREGKWRKYSADMRLSSGEFVISEPDENNNIAIYNHMFSPMQELNILKYSKLYLISDVVYAFNKDKLTLFKITYNGRTFNLYTLNTIDVTSVFPGIEVINMDSLASYDAVVLKDNAKAHFIILSRYSQGWNDYNLAPVQGEYSESILPNMFSVNSNSDVVISFGESVSEQNQEFSENKPSYKFIVRTRGHKEEARALQEQNTQLEDRFNQENAELQEEHSPNIMPKMLETNEEENKHELKQDDLLTPPKQEIEPPIEIEDVVE